MLKTVFITGSSSGIGRATAEIFADKGWNVVATMRDPGAAGGLTARGNVLITRLDVTEPESISPAIRAGVERFGRLDVLVNNAGYGQYGIFETTPAEKIRRNYDVNVFGLMEVTRAFLPVFREQGAGLVVNVSSMGGFFGLPAMSVYISTKFALEGFTESLSYELASQNIVVKLVEPGGTDTSFGDRAFSENAGTAAPESYRAFLEQTDAFFGRLSEGVVPPERIAEVIHRAATDGTRRLRYMAGDGVKHFVEARRSLSDEDYENYMRAQIA